MLIRSLRPDEPGDSARTAVLAADADTVQDDLGERDRLPQFTTAS
jgi:hypothetical protein